MNLQPVTGTPFTITCYVCKQRKPFGDGANGFADMSGEPWVAYYCRECVSVSTKPDGSLLVTPLPTALQSMCAADYWDSLSERARLEFIAARDPDGDKRWWFAQAGFAFQSNIVKAAVYDRQKEALRG